MKSFAVLFACVTFIFIFSYAAFSQTPSADWIRVHSDNGEFSIEVPAEYGFFNDNAGFSVSEAGSSHLLKEMNMLNAYHDKTLISFESYKADKKALDALREKESGDGKTSEIKLNETKIKQVIFRSQESYMVKRFFNSDNYIYILTAASRSGETPAIKRFLDSMIFDPKSKTTAANPKNLTFIKLKATPVEMNIGGRPGDNPIAGKDDKLTKLLILVKPTASYNEAARRNAQSGMVRMRITFSKEGRISNLNLMQIPDEGLARQSIFSAVRIKFLPQEINDQPVTVSKTLEYSFQIY